jgi:Zn finger protein HypA/HybF involved in hydrogenase expression
MTAPRSSSPGKARNCPHCKATILESTTICPVCHHHLKFEAVRTGRGVLPTFSPLRIEGTIRHPSVGEPWEYSIVLVVQDDRGEEVSRQVVGVGALYPTEARTFSLCVEVFAPDNRSV